MLIDDVLLCTEFQINTHLEFHMSLRRLNMDMRKAFDTIEHRALKQALRSRHLSEEYMALL